MNKPKILRGVPLPGLRSVREKAGLSRVELAKDTGLDYTFIWKIEERGIGVGYVSLHAIASRLSVSVEDLTKDQHNAVL